MFVPLFVLQGPDECFLAKSVTTSLQKRPIKDDPESADVDLGGEAACDAEDCDVTALDTDSCVVCRCDYHIVYSHSYQVPVLYFNMYKADGSLLSVEDVWSCVPGHYMDRLQQERWTFITQQEHPLLHKPFYQLHPCHTGELMGASQASAAPSPQGYLLRWLSCVGPVVGLHVPLAYAKYAP